MCCMLSYFEESTSAQEFPCSCNVEFPTEVFQEMVIEFFHSFNRVLLNEWRNSITISGDFFALQN